MKMTFLGAVGLLVVYLVYKDNKREIHDFVKNKFGKKDPTTNQNLYSAQTEILARLDELERLQRGGNYFYTTANGYVEKAGLRSCPKCGRNYTAGIEKYCPNCGTKLLF